MGQLYRAVPHNLEVTGDRVSYTVLFDRVSHNLEVTVHGVRSCHEIQE